jgi:transmembrane sensor
MDTKDIKNLLERYNSGNATSEEKALVEVWYLKYKDSDTYPPSGQLEQDQKESLKSLLGQIKAQPRKIQLSRYAIAASILVFLAAGGYWVIFKGQQKQQIAINKPSKHDLAPGGNRAILTLSDGSKIVLNNAKKGTLATQGNTRVNKTADGLISYTNATDKTASNVIAYNTASTPRGGQFQFVLSDGTKIWLNAASSIKYPVTFNGHERKVELTGEAYFEVAHNTQKPFRVVSNGQTVEVLGTHFNINAYSDEGVVKTTLLEGSVKVSSGLVSNIIKPGEQAQFRNGSISVIDNADLDATVSWKNGLFHFEDNSIQEVMRQLARWYDVDIKYQGQASQRLFSGEISRNVNASQILDILSFKKIHYKIEGKSIVITP